MVYIATLQKLDIQIYIELKHCVYAIAYIYIASLVTVLVSIYIGVLSYKILIIIILLFVKIINCHES